MPKCGQSALEMCFWQKIVWCRVGFCLRQMLFFVGNDEHYCRNPQYPTTLVVMIPKRHHSGSAYSLIQQSYQHPALPGSMFPSLRRTFWLWKKQGNVNFKVWGAAPQRNVYRYIRYQRTDAENTCIELVQATSGIKLKLQCFFRKQRPERGTCAWSEFLYFLPHKEEKVFTFTDLFKSNVFFSKWCFKFQQKHESREKQATQAKCTSRNNWDTWSWKTHPDGRRNG